MSGVHGADPEGLDELARMLEETAERLRRILAYSRSLGDRVVWAGTDADVFRRSIADDLGASIARSSDAIRRAAEDVRRNANQQREASGTGAAGAGATTGPSPSATFPFLLAGAAGGGRIGEAAASAMGGVLLGGAAPPPDWDTSPRVAALIDLVERAPAPSAVTGLAQSGDASTGVSADLTDSQALTDPSASNSWADQLFGAS